MTDIDLSKLTIARSREAGGKSGLAWYVVPLTLLVAGAGIAVRYGRSAGSPEAEISSHPTPPAATAPAPAAASAGLLNATGYVVAQRKAAVASKATGRLVELRVEEGDVVREDQVLGTLENEDLKAIVREREAQLEAAEAQIRVSEAELADAKLGRDRALRLRDQRVASQEQLDTALARFSKAAALLVSAQANRRLAAAELERAKVDLSYTAILAPFDGTVLTKNADVGEIVAPFGSSTSARAAIVTLADMKSLQVEADVSEANLGKVHVGQSCEIMLDSIPGKRYRGQVSKIVPTVDRAKGTVMTKIRFQQLGPEIIPEMSAKVAFELGSGS